MARQKDRVQWLNLGDQNTGFFFKSINKQRIRNRVVSVTLEDGTIIVDDVRIREEIVDVFQSLKANKAPGTDGYSAGFFKRAG